MSERLTIRLFNAQQGYKAFKDAWQTIKAWLTAGHRLVLSVKPVAAAGIPWAGKNRTATEWKVLLVSGHAVATKQGSDMVPGLEGEFVNLRESTAHMSIARASSLIEYTLAFCAAHEVPIRGAQQWRVDAETGEVMT